ncbi:hypothetical protein [Mycolicibacterium aubagnense]|nr:hypothetical protein [Mycolicibacterium aubagnense]WGI35295.1 hypothetical protein QDT91_13670 [Mycolicibacterium aubagnense]
MTRSFDQQRSLHNTTDGFVIVGGAVVAVGGRDAIAPRKPFS